MEKNKLDELLCEMMTQVSPLFDGQTTPAEQAEVCLSEDVSSRILARVKARIAAGGAVRHGSAGFVATAGAPSANQQIRNRPTVRVVASAPARQPARLGFEELESRDSPSVMSGLEPCPVAATVSTWELVRTIPEWVCSYACSLGWSQPIAVVW